MVLQKKTISEPILLLLCFFFIILKLIRCVNNKSPKWFVSICDHCSIDFHVFLGSTSPHCFGWRNSIWNSWTCRLSPSSVRIETKRTHSSVVRRSKERAIDGEKRGDEIICVDLQHLCPRDSRSRGRTTERSRQSSTRQSNNGRTFRLRISSGNRYTTGRFIVEIHWWIWK